MELNHAHQIFKIKLKGLICSYIVNSFKTSVWFSIIFSRVEDF